MRLSLALEWSLPPLVWCDFINVLECELGAFDVSIRSRVNALYGFHSMSACSEKGVGTALLPERETFSLGRFHPNRGPSLYWSESRTVKFQDTAFFSSNSSITQAATRQLLIPRSYTVLRISLYHLRSLPSTQRHRVILAFVSRIASAILCSSLCLCQDSVRFVQVLCLLQDSN